MNDGQIKLNVAWSSKIEVFEKVFGLHYSELFSFCNKKVNSEALAKDILQEAFMALWDNLSIVETPNDLLPYLYGVIRHKVLDNYRKSEIYLRFAVEAANRRPSEETSETIFLKKELESVISDEVKKMPSRMQEIYLLKTAKNSSIKEIAAALGLSEQTVKNQLQNAYGRLKSRVKEYNSPIMVVGFVMGYLPVLLHH